MFSLSRNARMALLFATIAASSLPIACGTPTTLTSEWKDPSRVGHPVGKVVVIALRLPPAQRRLIEDRLVADLAKQGTPAAPSYRILGDPLPPRDAARASLEQAGYDGALVVSLRAVRNEPTYVPGGYTSVWGSPYWGGSTYDPGYVVNEKIVTFDSTLWDLRDGQRVWAASTDTTNPSSGSDSAKSLSKELVPRLEELKLVGPGK